MEGDGVGDGVRSGLESGGSEGLVADMEVDRCRKRLRHSEINKTYKLLLRMRRQNGAKVIS